MAVNCNARRALNLNVSNRFHVNTQQFSEDDLVTYVESIEIIERIERERYARLPKRKQPETKLPKRFVTQAQVHSIPEEYRNDYKSYESIFSAAEIEAEYKRLSSIERTKKSSSPTNSNEYDETYFSQPASAQNSPRDSPIYALPKHMPKTKLIIDVTATSSTTKASLSTAATTSSDSEDSGVYYINALPHYEPINYSHCATPAIHPRPHLIDITAGTTEDLNLIETLGSVDISSLENTETDAEIADVTSTNQSAETVVETDGRKQRRGTFTRSVRRRLRRGGGKTENFLTKALRYLTL